MVCFSDFSNIYGHSEIDVCTRKDHAVVAFAYIYVFVLSLIVNNFQLLFLSSGLYLLFTEVNRSVQSDHWVIATALE